MEKDSLSQLWHSKKENTTLLAPEDIIKKAAQQRNRQVVAITVLSVTVTILVAYALYFFGNRWNSFSLGLLLMISSLSFRIIVELLSLYQKDSRLISLDSVSFKRYLKSYHSMRLKVNYFITPVCFAVYVFGFTLLLPYFKKGFSESLYNYIIVSGILSLLAVAAIIINGVIKEIRFLNHLENK